MKQNHSQEKTPHAPGPGSDKQHPETPDDANERFRKEQENEKSGK